MQLQLLWSCKCVYPAAQKAAVQQHKGHSVWLQRRQLSLCRLLLLSVILSAPHPYHPPSHVSLTCCLCQLVPEVKQLTLQLSKQLSLAW